MEDTPEQAGRELIPAGIYDCFIESAEAKLSRAGNKMIEWRMKAMLPNDGGEYTIFLHTTNSEKDKPRLKAYVNIAAPGEVNWATDGLATVAACLPGKWVRARLRQQASTEYGPSMSVSALLPYQQPADSFAQS